MAKIEQVIFYKTEDGSVFPTMQAATEYNASNQISVRLSVRLKDFLDSPQCNLADYAYEDDRGNEAFNRDSITDFIMENWQVLADIMRKIQEVTVYQTEDGSIFHQKIDAIRHCETSSVAKQISELLDGLNLDAYAHETDAGYIALDIDGLKDFLIAERDMIVKALTIDKGPETETDW